MTAGIGQQGVHGVEAARMRQRPHLHALHQAITDFQRAGCAW